MAKKSKDTAPFEKPLEGATGVENLTGEAGNEAQSNPGPEHSEGEDTLSLLRSENEELRKLHEETCQQLDEHRQKLAEAGEHIKCLDEHLAARQEDIENLEAVLKQKPARPAPEDMLVVEVRRPCRVAGEMQGEGYAVAAISLHPGVTLNWLVDSLRDGFLRDKKPAA